MMEGLRLILNDGTVIENGEAGLSSNFLWLWIPISFATMPEVVSIVFDKLKMSKIVFQFGEMENVFVGYTACISISMDTDNISVCMVKEG